MLKKDYLMEMIGAMAEAIGKIIFHKERGEYYEAHSEADNIYQTLTGMPLQTLLSLSGHDILNFLYTFGEMDPQKALMLIDVFKEDSDVFRADGDLEIADELMNKCSEMIDALDDTDLDASYQEELDHKKVMFCMN